MFIDATTLNFDKFANIPANSLILVQRDSTAFWMLDRGSGERDAVFLTDFGGHRWATMDAKNNDSWSGIFVTDVVIEVDVTSRVSGGSEALGMVRADSGKLQLYVKENGHGFWESEWADFGAASGVIGRAGMFSRWRLTSGTGDDKVLLVEYDNGAVTILGVVS